MHINRRLITFLVGGRTDINLDMKALNLMGIDRLIKATGDTEWQQRLTATTAAGQRDGLVIGGSVLCGVGAAQMGLDGSSTSALSLS